MKADSRIFGKIEIEDDKIITLEKGMIGFPDLNHFALIYDEEKEKKYNSIMWLQSMDDPDHCISGYDAAYRQGRLQPECK